MYQPKEVFVRLDRCMGCHSCEIACSVEHSQSKNLYLAMYEAPVPKKRLYVEWAPDNKKVPVLCRHCEDSPCMHACISGAISRTEHGKVVTNTDKCIGCWTCVMVCPYGVTGRHMEDQKAYKCDNCPDRNVPACVNSCPTKALVYRSVENHSEKIRKAAALKIAMEQGEQCGK